MEIQIIKKTLQTTWVNVLALAAKKWNLINCTMVSQKKLTNINFNSVIISLRLGGSYENLIN